jgi:hypothetical protein
MIKLTEALTTAFDQLSHSGWAVTIIMLAIIAPLLVRVVQEFLKARIHLVELETRPKIITGELQTGIRPSARNVVDTNFNILEKYYDQTLAENRLLSRAAVGVSLLGFFVILVGVSLAFSGYTSVGVVSSVAGLLAEAATLMFFNQLREQVRQVQDYHKKLVSTQYLMTSIAMTDNLGSGRHDVEIVRIINNLLFLSNELHGSKSDHLFDRTNLLADPSNQRADKSVLLPGEPTASGAVPASVFPVGTLVSERPPDSSERAQFGHSAPTSGV